MPFRPFCDVGSLALLAACHRAPEMEYDNPGHFRSDLAFLRGHDSVIVLENGDAKVVVSPKYQGKVFTSTAAGDTGLSFGWVHYSAFDKPLDPHMNAFGGENRVWLGP